MDIIPSERKDHTDVHICTDQSRPNKLSDVDDILLDIFYDIFCRRSRR